MSSIADSSLKGKRVAIVGAGVSGLVAAYRLQQHGAQVAVFEQCDYVGGRTRSLRVGEFIIDIGALTLMPTYKNMIALVDELGIRPHLIDTRPQLAIVRDGKLHSIDLGNLFGSLRKLKLISARSLWKLLKLVPVVARHWRHFNYHSMGVESPLDQETVRDFCLRVLNEEIADYLASPAIRAGSMLSTREAPAWDWLWQMAGYRYPRMMQFDQGMDFFAQSLARGLDVRLQTEVLRVEREGARVRIHALTGSGVATADQYDACVLALPVTQARMLADAATEQEDRFLSEVRGVPLISLHLGLHSIPAIEAAVIMIPEKESSDLLLILLDHNKVKGRAPEGKGIVTIWSSKEWASQHGDRDDDEIAAKLIALAQPFIGNLDGRVAHRHVNRRAHAVTHTQAGFFRDLGNYMKGRDLNQPVFYSSDIAAEGIEGATISGLEACGHVRSFLLDDLAAADGSAR